jgi:hypothetical protein
MESTVKSIKKELASKEASLDDTEKMKRALSSTQKCFQSAIKQNEKLNTSLEHYKNEAINLRESQQKAIEMVGSGI